MGNLNAIIQEALASLKRFYATIDELPGIVEKPDAVALVLKTATISFADVSFGYRDDHAAVSGLTLTAKAGKVTALVGRSGSGKSTLLALVPRLYDVTGGRISIDGQDVRDVTLQTLRAQIAVVSQDVMLFAYTHPRQHSLWPRRRF